MVIKSKRVPRYIKRMLDAHNHPSVIVRQAAATALRGVSGRTYKGEVDSLDAFKNLYDWLNRCEPGWKTKRTVTWSCF